MPTLGAGRFVEVLPTVGEAVLYYIERVFMIYGVIAGDQLAVGANASHYFTGDTPEHGIVGKAF